MCIRDRLISGEKDTVVAHSDQKLIPNQFFETFLAKKEIQIEDLITVLNSKTEKNSLFEIQNKDNLKSGFNLLKDQFDVIIIDINSLKNINHAKEWLLFTEKNIAIFEAGRSLTDNETENMKYISGHSGFIGWVLNKQIES
nr:hypothetical protein [Pedobacter sp. ASV19]